MSIQIITAKPNEEGTAIASVSLVDDAGNSLTFAQLSNPKWQLSRLDGTVVDGCSFADSDLTALSWVIKGSDLALFGSTDGGARALTFIATYDSDAGLDLPLHAECRFRIQDLVGIK